MRSKGMKSRKDCDLRFITRKWAPAMGGMETYCLRLTECLSIDNTLDIIALAGRSDGGPPSALHIARFGLQTAWRLLFAKQAPVVHLADVSLWPLGWLVSMRHKQSKIIISAHGSDVSYAKRGGFLPKLYGAYVTFGAKKLRRAIVIANSNWIKGLCLQFGFQNVHTIYMGTDIKAQETSLNHNGKLFFAGRILKSKGLSHFVKTVLQTMDVPPILRVAGTIWDEDEGKILRSKHIEYLGVLEKDALAHEYAQAMCVIVPSLGHEGFGLVVVEAAAVGGVVIGAAHSGLAEACDGVAGFKADIDKPDQWISLIETISEWTADERQKYIANKSSNARSFYSWKRVAKETLEIYKL